MQAVPGANPCQERCPRPCDPPSPPGPLRLWPVSCDRGLLRVRLALFSWDESMSCVQREKSSSVQREDSCNRRVPPDSEFAVISYSDSSTFVAKRLFANTEPAVSQ